MQRIILLCIAVMLSGCSTYHSPSQINIGDPLIQIDGESLSGESYTLPQDLDNQPAILLFGYVHKSQFDIDRWLIGLDMRDVNTAILEIPAIQNPLVRFVRDRFDDSMREGIPKEFWAKVITVYADGDKVQSFTGNQKPKNARVILVDENGAVQFFYDRGFSVDALNGLIKAIETIE